MTILWYTCNRGDKVNIKEFISLCNINAGFIQIILAILSLLLSILAIIISILTARLPYKKRVLLTYGSYIGVGFEGSGIFINATNVGNRDIYIKNFCISFDKKTNLQKRETIDGLLRPGQSINLYYSDNEFNINNFKENKFFVYLEDTENKKKYKKIKQK